MDKFNSIREEILQTGKNISELLGSFNSIPSISGRAFEYWEKMCDRILKQIPGDIIRVAVVGPIKSGKSTFINSILNGDYLKRGAGVVTSFITRIRKGATLKAVLYFKSWDDVNAEIEQALIFLPSPEWRALNEKFDLRNEKNRLELQKVLDELSPDLVMENGILNANFVLILNYLNGYEKIKKILDSENSQIEYVGDNFSEHKEYIGDDSLSVYLKDIQLEIVSEILKNNVEITDCQGSDSPNPLHMALIQDYLALAHLAVYVISSRTDIREADVRFLTMLKKMGILDNILFVVNCDFGEHDSIDDLNAVSEKIKKEISMLKPEPEIFVFSSLFNLFKSQTNSLMSKDFERLSQWTRLTDFVEASNLESERFMETFIHQIVENRFSLLLKNHLERLNVIVIGLNHWIMVNLEILAGDLNNATRFIEKIKQHEEKISRIKLMIKDTMDGAVRKLLTELKTETDRFFSVRSGELVNSILEFIRNYRVSYHDYEKKLAKSGFNSALFLVYQDFKKEIDRFMTEFINPGIIRFIKDKEKRIEEFLESVSAPYERMVLDALCEYNETIKTFGILPMPVEHKVMEHQNIDYIKQAIGLTIPSAETAMHFSYTVKTDAIIHFGFYKLIGIVKRLFKKSSQNQSEEAMRALKNGALRMKKETEKSIAFHFKNLKENIKFQYLLKLVEGATNFSYEEINNRFKIYLTDLAKLTDLVNEKGALKEDALKILRQTNITVKTVLKKVEQIRLAIEKSGIGY